MTSRPALAVTCHDPVGAFAAGARLAAPAVRALFGSLVINATDESAPATVDELAALTAKTVVERHPAGSIGVGTARRRAVELALGTDSAHVLYSDVDHLLRWAIEAPDELRAVLAAGCASEAALVIIGRSTESFAREPARLRLTEGAVNRAASLALGVTEDWDLMIAVRLLGRTAAQLVVDRCGESSIANDVAWPLLVHRAGLTVGYLPAHGLAYRHRDDFGAEADDRDRSAVEWTRRIELAAVHAGAIRAHLDL